MQSKTLSLSIFLSSIILGTSLFISVSKYKEFDRVVKVKGLSEITVKSNHVYWPIKFSVLGNNSEDIYKKLSRDKSKIVSLLKKEGFEEKDISISRPTVQDKLAQSYTSEKPEFRYVAYQTISLTTTNVDKVGDAAEKISELGEAGIFFSNDPYADKIVYSFTDLNSVKPTMIEDATKNARKSAEKFAQDSHSKLGKLKAANQGQILIRDKNNPIEKRIRVVTSVEYYLVD